MYVCDVVGDCSPGTQIAISWSDPDPLAKGNCSTCGKPIAGETFSWHGLGQHMCVIMSLVKLQEVLVWFLLSGLLHVQLYYDNN